ncbi:MAG TPA: alpha/beta hydrolase [Chromatiales bacterium]|nr:alpha/beta hydrolase [Thiotrichales bacterium]HIP67180.1 alpha/beta hydrolase [Chromatiales bacterium]
MSKTQRKKFRLKNQNGHYLAAVLELPEERPVAQVLYAHCFTCSKDIITASRISRALVKNNYSVARFDFSGLGESEGDFEKTNFSTNIQDIVSTADYLRENYQVPELLIGHSLGGAAALAAVKHVPECKAVVTLAAPADPENILTHFKNARTEIIENGETQVIIGGKNYILNQQFLDDVDNYNLSADITNLNKPLLILHSPDDKTVSIEHANKIFETAHYPKNFISLDGTDHLLTNREDAAFVADIISTWVRRYL